MQIDAYIMDSHAVYVHTLEENVFAEVQRVTSKSFTTEAQHQMQLNERRNFQNSTRGRICKAKLAAYMFYLIYANKNPDQMDNLKKHAHELTCSLLYTAKDPNQTHLGAPMKWLWPVSDILEKYFEMALKYVLEDFEVVEVEKFPFSKIEKKIWVSEHPKWFTRKLE